jgi:pimeloyl-ACP methyl ester carboxylesterase
MRSSTRPNRSPDGGELPAETTPEDGGRTAAHIKGGQFIEMEDIGHFPMSENHEVFRRYLLEALDSIGSREATAQA